MAQIDKALEDRLAELVKDRETKRQAHVDAIARMQGELADMDGEIESIERTRIALKAQKGKAPA